LLDFLFKSKKRSSRKNRASVPFQKQLEFQVAPQRKSRFPSKAISFKQMEGIVKDDLEIFQAHMKEVREASLKLEELEKMLRSGEITENTYDVIAAELGERIVSSLEEIFKLKGSLELARTRAKLEWAKEKAEMTSAGIMEERALTASPEPFGYSPLQRWEKLISSIDEALSSLTIDEEISFLERYLSLTKEGNPSKERLEAIGRARELCRKRLVSIRETWNSTRREKIEQMISLEHEASQLKEQIREAEVRFAIGYYDEAAFEARISDLKANLQKVEREISKLKDYLDEMDRKVFRCSELLEENL